jgi:hypothetical protein
MLIVPTANRVVLLCGLQLADVSRLRVDLIASCAGVRDRESYSDVIIRVAWDRE